MISPSFLICFQNSPQYYQCFVLNARETLARERTMARERTAVPEQQLLRGGGGADDDIEIGAVPAAPRRVTKW